MGREKTKPVVWLLLYRKVPLKDVIRLGFKKTTVYSYSARWPHVQEDFKKAMKKLKELRKE